MRVELTPFATMFNDVYPDPMNYVNTTCLIVKQNIYATRCKEEQLNLDVVLFKIIEYKTIEEFIARKNNKLNKHMNKWSVFDTL